MLRCMSPLSIAALRQIAGETPVHAVVSCQVQAVTERTTKNGKPYYELALGDATGSFSLKLWSDTENFAAVGELEPSSLLQFEAAWTQNTYGLEAKALRWKALEPDEVATFLAGDPELQRKQDDDFATIVDCCSRIQDLRLRTLSECFFESFGARFRRTAAARKNHHARRGGLVEHVAQMIRSAEAMCLIYPELNRDLLLAGVLFHDCGKLWENSYGEKSFVQHQTLSGELLGHIPLGIEIVNRLWQDMVHDLDEATSEAWARMQPSNDHTRLHLLHLIGSHHGQYEFGSPVLPRTPEAYALHYIDNLDAKMEMLRDAYRNGTENSTGVFERVFPLPSNLVRPLPPWSEAPKEPEAENPPSFVEANP